ncbi:MAG: HepT-like ribonuclease domain-containing protein [Egibacteraceae bacterium]
MLDSIETIKRHTQGGLEVLDDEVVGAAVMRWIEILGEAASRLTSDLRESYPDIPWAGVIGMRNRLVHGYFEIDADRVWAAIEHELSPSRQVFEPSWTIHRSSTGTRSCRRRRRPIGCRGPEGVPDTSG